MNVGFEDNELEKNSTIRKFRIVQKEGNRGVSREVAHYKCKKFKRKLEKTIDKTFCF